MKTTRGVDSYVLNPKMRVF
eukprot:maker-scaffold_31-snap-gene-3.74-mRNA-1 protein AED:0.32 eAED:0.34 QI:60/0/0/1/0/0/3/195/19